MVRCITSTTATTTNTALVERPLQLSSPTIKCNPQRPRCLRRLHLLFSSATRCVCHLLPPTITAVQAPQLTPDPRPTHHLNNLLLAHPRQLLQRRKPRTRPGKSQQSPRPSLELPHRAPRLQITFRDPQSLKRRTSRREQPQRTLQPTTRRRRKKGLHSRSRHARKPLQRCRDFSRRSPDESALSWRKPCEPRPKRVFCISVTVRAFDGRGGRGEGEPCAAGAEFLQFHECDVG